MIAVHPIQETDLDSLADLYGQLLEEPTNLIKMRQIFQRIQSNPAYLLLGAKDESGTLLGSLLSITCMDLIGDCRPFMVLENVIVAASSRGMGVGRAMMLHVEEIARNSGCAYIMLVSSGFRKQAHLFYDAMGYRLDEVKGFRKYLEE